MYHLNPSVLTGKEQNFTEGNQKLETISIDPDLETLREMIQWSNRTNCHEHEKL